MDKNIKQENMNKAVNLSNVAETSLLTLYCRAIESQSADPILRDEQAVVTTKKLNPILAASSNKLAQSLANGKVNKQLVVHIALRARRYDEYAKSFLLEHRRGVIVNIGCGMDTRFSRIDNGEVNFFDLDLPEVIQIKRQLMEENQRYHMIASSVFDYGWMEQIVMQPGQSALFLAEGVFMYLDPDKVRSLVLAIQERFPGTELVCEVVNSLYLNKFWQPMVKRKMQRGAGLGKDAVFKFGIPNSRAMEEWGAGIEFLGDWFYFDSDHPKLGWLRWFKSSKLFRQSQWTVHYRLNQV